MNSRGLSTRSFYTKSRSVASSDLANACLFHSVVHGDGQDQEISRSSLSLSVHSLSQRLKLSQRGHGSSARNCGPPSSAPRSRRAWTSRLSAYAAASPLHVPRTHVAIRFCLDPRRPTRQLVSSLPPSSHHHLSLCFLQSRPSGRPAGASKKTKWVIIRTEQERTEKKRKRPEKKDRRPRYLIEVNKKG